MFLPINKPVGLTSFRIVGIVRRLTGVRKVGHAGTLDPLASGVLVVAVGRDSTKKIDNFVRKEKEYIAEIQLGETSTTDDEEGKKTAVNQQLTPAIDGINKTLTSFTGIIEQIPPLYSAVKVKGKEAYKYARAGQMVDLKPRKREVKKIEILEYNYPVLKLRITTGKGVYIRSIARDLGDKLGTGAYLKSLVRTRVGEYRLENAIDLDDLEEYLSRYT